MHTKIELKDFTVRNLRAPTTEDTIQIADAKVSGFGVRVSKSGTKTFYFQYRHNGAPFRISLGRYPDISLAEARAQAEVARGTLRAGRNPNSLRTKGTVSDPVTVREVDLVTAPTFAKALEIYIQERKSTLRPSTAHEKARNIRSKFLHRWRHQPVNEITTSDIKEVLNACLEQGYPSAANHALADIRTFFKWCVKSQKYMSQSPADGIARPARVRTRDRYLKPDEIRLIWKAAEQEPLPLGYLTQIALLTIQRRGEVAQMKWSDLNFERGYWEIPAERTKSGRAHVVPLSNLAVEVLNRIPRQALPLRECGKDLRLSPYVFPSPKDSSKPLSSFSSPKKRLEEKANVSDWGLHDLRRTATTALGHFRILPKVKKKILNHAENEVTDIYDRFEYFEERCEAMHFWEDYLRKVIAGAMKMDTADFRNPFLKPGLAIPAE